MPTFRRGFDPGYWPVERVLQDQYHAEIVDDVREADEWRKNVRKSARSNKVVGIRTGTPVRLPSGRYLVEAWWQHPMDSECDGHPVAYLVADLVSEIKRL